jgi:hypothetical protein
MIKGITPTGRYTVVSGGTAMNPYIAPGGQSAGMTRYNTNMNVLEVYDGITWKEIGSSYASVGLTSEAESLLDWARNKMAEELKYKALANEHPAVKIALENLERAKQQLDATIILSKEHDTTS